MGREGGVGHSGTRSYGEDVCEGAVDCRGGRGVWGEMVVVGSGGKTGEGWENIWALVTEGRELGGLAVEPDSGGSTECGYGGGVDGRCRGRWGDAGEEAWERVVDTWIVGEIVKPVE